MHASKSSSTWLPSLSGFRRCWSLSGHPHCAPHFGPQVRYDDKEVREELLPNERVEVPLLQESGAAWPGPSCEQLNALGAHLLLKAEEAEATAAAAAAGGTSRSRSLTSKGRPPP